MKPESKTFKTTMSDNELAGLVGKYAEFYQKKFKYVWKVYAEYEDIYGALAIKALEARADFAKKEQKTSNIRTYVISGFRKRMEDFRQYLWVRQCKYGGLMPEMNQALNYYSE